MDKLKYVKVEQIDGTYSESIPLAVDAINIDMVNGQDLQETIGNVNINNNGNVAQQLDNLNNRTIEIEGLRTNFQGELYNTAALAQNNAQKKLNNEINFIHKNNLSQQYLNRSSIARTVHIDTNEETSCIVTIRGETIKTLQNTSQAFSPENPYNFSSSNGLYNTEIILNGTEVISQRTSYSPTHITFIIENILIGRVLNTPEIYCSHFKTSPSDIDLNNNETCSGGSSGTSLINVYISIEKNKLKTQDVNGFKQYLANQYNAGDPVKIWYWDGVSSTNDRYSIIGFIEDGTLKERKWGLKSGIIYGDNSVDNYNIFCSTMSQLMINNLSNADVSLNTNTNQNYTKFIIANILPTESKAPHELECNRFTVSITANNAAAGGNYICSGESYAGLNRNLYISIANSYLSDISTSAAKIDSFKTWVSNHPIIINYDTREIQQFYYDYINIEINKSGTFRTYRTPEDTNNNIYGGYIEVAYNTTSACDNKKITFIGDSYIANNNHPLQDTWAYKFARKNNMIYHFMGVNGSRVCPTRGQSVYERYSSIPIDSDYIIICAGHNDANSNISIADFKTYMSEICAGIIARCPLAKIAWVSPWNQYGNAALADKQPGFTAIIEAEKEVCLLYGIPFFDNRESGMMMAYTAFQNEYAYDYAHLNSKGHNLFLNKIENWLKRL